jgi:hypothetical protein
VALPPTAHVMSHTKKEGFLVYPLHRARTPSDEFSKGVAFSIRLIVDRWLRKRARNIVVHLSLFGFDWRQNGVIYLALAARLVLTDRTFFSNCR